MTEEKIKEDLVTLEDAARELRIEVKRLRGYLYDERPWIPIGDAQRVYDWSLRYIRERLEAERAASAATVTTNG